MPDNWYPNDKTRATFAKSAQDVNNDYKNKRDTASGMADNPPSANPAKVSPDSIHKFLDNQNSKDTSPSHANANKAKATGNVF